MQKAGHVVESWKLIVAGPLSNRSHALVSKMDLHIASHNQTPRLIPIGSWNCAGRSKNKLNEANPNPSILVIEF